MLSTAMKWCAAMMGVPVRLSCLLASSAPPHGTMFDVR